MLIMIINSLANWKISKTKAAKINLRGFLNFWSLIQISICELSHIFFSSY